MCKEKIIEHEGKKYRVIEEIKSVEITKELVVKRLQESYYKFSSEEVNSEFRKDLETINYDLREADLSEADLSEADLRKADLREADLSEANLSEADLRKADLNAIFFKTKITKTQRKYITEETDLFDVEDE